MPTKFHAPILARLPFPRPKDATLPRNEDGSGSNAHVTRKCRAVIDLLIEDLSLTQSAACERIGMDKAAFSRAIRRPHVQAYLREHCTRSIGGVTLIRATARLAKLIDAKSESVAADISTRIAEAGGVLVPREAHNPLPPGAGGPAIVFVFKHVQTPQIRPADAHVSTLNLQAVEVVGRSEPEHVLAKDEVERSKAVATPGAS